MRYGALVFTAVVAVAVVAGSVMSSGIKSPLVCFGDSITHGAKVNGHSWVYLLSKEHKDVAFINEGRNGRRTSDREEILPVLKKYNQAGTFLIFLGVNDLKNGNDSMVDDCVTDMKWMIKKVRQYDRAAEIVILAPCRIDLKEMSPLNVRKKYNENTERSLVILEKQYGRLAQEESVGFISLLNAVTPGNYVDGLHPNLAGQQEIADAVWRGLERLSGQKARRLGEAVGE